MMSFYEKQIENDSQKHFQSEQTTKKSSKSELYFDHKPSGYSGTWMNSDLDFTSQGKQNTPPEIEGWRRAVREDENAIKQLQELTGDVTGILYRRKSVNELIEKCYFPVVQFNTKGDLISFTAYDSYPDLPFAPFWMDWLKINYQLNGICPGNVFFVHYMVWQPDQEDIFFPLLLQTSFTEFLYLKYIIIIQPPKTNIPDFYRKFFFPVLPVGMDKFDTSSTQLLHICYRTTVIHPLPIRTAVEQEFEVITSVLGNNLKERKIENASTIWDLLNFLYQKDRKTLICELEGKLAGVMILNLKTDLDHLNEGFELGPFNGLRKKLLENDEFLKSDVFEKTTKPLHIATPNKFLLPSVNWEVSFSNINREASNSTNISSYFSTPSSLSQFSFSQLSSLLEESNDTSQSLFQGKNDMISKLAGDVHSLVRTAGNKITHFFPPKYTGPSNAFVIDFFAIDWNKINEKLSFFDFLQAAFKLVPDREYCVLLIPTNFLHCPLLDLFVRVTPKLLSRSKQELYLCHKNSLSVISMSVRSAQRDDLDDISNFLKQVDDGDTVYNDILKCFEDNIGFKSFVFTFENTIIGVSLINSQDYFENFRMYFEVADLVPPELNQFESSSIIKHLVINPKYNNQARFFVRDIMRLADVTCLFYASHKPFKNHSSLVTVLGQFTQVKPKRKVELNDPFLTFEHENYKHPFSLFILHPQLCGFNKIQLNIIIVVVGASRTALSFMESLIFGSAGSYYNFNNIICVSPRGLEIDDVEENLKNFMFPTTDNFSRSYLSMLSLNTYVSCVNGYMTEINRSEKYIVVNHKSIIRYDYLILTCGLQYIAPIPDILSVRTKPKCVFKSSLSRFLHGLEKQNTYRTPNLHNMFIINSIKDAQVALQALQYLMQKLTIDGRKIIVYGHDLHVFLTINTLLKMGIPGDFIAFVEPFPTDTNSVTLFNDDRVDQAVIESVKECKVSYYTDYYLHDWVVSSENYITSVKFYSKRKQIIIPCLAFFPFIEKLVSEVTFNACNDAGLVYDGKLVINHNFRTNDKNIYAAGPLTKYARRYYASEKNHQHFNSREVGQKLADIIRGKIDPLAEDTTTEAFELVPQFVTPIFYHCHLPGDLNLFSLRKPGKNLDLETAYNFSDYGEVIVTGDCKTKYSSGYFRLHLNSEGFVESITCLTKNKIDYLNLASLYGLHERVLNNLLLRHDLSMIPDLFEYFRQPWALALFHENFQQLRDLNYKVFLQKEFSSTSFCDRVIEELQAANWERLDEPVIDQLSTEYSFSHVEDDIKNNLLKFLEYYKEDLPVYSNPNKARRSRHKPFFSNSNVNLN